MLTGAYPMESVMEHLSRVAGKYADVDSAIMAVLLALNVPADRDGFKYLRVAIESYMRDPTQTMTKELYPQIAGLFSREPNGMPIERTIRSCVSVAFDNRNTEVWNLYFPEGCAGNHKKPTNHQFISRIASLIHLWLNMKK